VAPNTTRSTIVPGEGIFYAVSVVSLAKYLKILFVVASLYTEELHVIDL
jgi:hypothetical protein